WKALDPAEREAALTEAIALWEEWLNADPETGSSGVYQMVGHKGDLMFIHFQSEEHTSELQSRENLVCRLLLEKKKTDADYRRVTDPDTLWAPSRARAAVAGGGAAAREAGQWVHRRQRAEGGGDARAPSHARLEVLAGEAPVFRPTPRRRRSCAACPCTTRFR